MMGLAQIPLLSSPFSKKRCQQIPNNKGPIIKPAAYSHLLAAGKFFTPITSGGKQNSKVTNMAKSLTGNNGR